MPFDAVADLVAAAARNNAEWCETVCRSHGIVGRFEAGLWSSAVRTPSLYPDAVTLDPSVTAATVLREIDSSPGCSIKDSFATLELASHGFDVLFDAMWITRPPGAHTEATGPIKWVPVTDLARFKEWEHAWRGADVDAAGILTPSLLSEASVDVLAGERDGVLVAGAMVNRSDHVLGISNVFSRGHDVDETWSSLRDRIAHTDPGRPIVGYESGPDLEAAIAAGFTALGPLRVWLRRF